MPVGGTRDLDKRPVHCSHCERGALSRLLPAKEGSDPTQLALSCSFRGTGANPTVRQIVRKSAALASAAASPPQPAGTAWQPESATRASARSSDAHACSSRQPIPGSGGGRNCRKERASFCLAANGISPIPFSKDASRSCVKGY